MDPFARQCTHMVAPSAGFLLFLLLTGCCCSSASRKRSDSTIAVINENLKDLRESLTSTPTLVRKYGYPFETHLTVTEDGYVISLHRIPHGRTGDDLLSGDKPLHYADTPSNSDKRAFRTSGPQSQEKQRPAVLLTPGLLCSSAIYVIAGPERGLAFYLADAGYDVWIMNPRGTPYSMGHLELPPTDDRFWQFSWHEIGMFDVPAALDLVTKRTGFRRVPIVGHSMGNTVMMVVGSLKPEVADKVTVVAALAPTVYMRHSKSMLMRTISSFVPAFTNVTDALQAHSLNLAPFKKLFIQACRDNSITQSVCKAVITMCFGADPDQLDTTMLPALLTHFPSTSSVNTVFHFGQLFNHGDFRQFDFNSKRNMERYGSAIPPKYNLSRVRFPVAMFYAENDYLSSVQDVDYLGEQLLYVVEKYRVPWPKFNHMDFLFAINVQSLVFDPVLDLLRKYAPS